MNMPPQIENAATNNTPADDTVLTAQNPNLDRDAESEDFSDITDSAQGVLLASILIVALCGIVYELIIGAVSSYLLGNSIYQFSITVGFFMFAMGIGSYLSQYIRNNLIHYFVIIEIILAVVGGICSISLFLIFPFSPYMYRTVMMAFIIAIGTLVGLEIPILTRIMAQAEGTRRSIAKVLSFDYIGALIGSVAFPLLLLPSLGLVRASFAIGLINICVALLTILFMRRHLKHPKAMLAVVLAIAISLTALITLGSRISAAAQQHLYFDQVIWKKDTPYQSLTMTQSYGNNDLRLFIDGHLQFSESDEHRYHETLVHSVLGLEGRRENILVLGGGDGLAVREILKYKDVKHIDLVDLDPAMTELGAEFPPLVKLNKSSLANPKVTIYNQDAFVFIKDKGRTYDRVIIDMPDPHNEAISKLYAIEFYAMISQRMHDDAVLISQSSSPYFARNAFWCVGATLAEIFPQTQALQVTTPSFGVWGFQTAAKREGRLEGAIDLQGVKTRFWTPNVLSASQVFGKDIDMPAAMKANPKINSIFEPIIYQLYLKDVTTSAVKRAEES